MDTPYADSQHQQQVPYLEQQYVTGELFNGGSGQFNGDPPQQFNGNPPQQYVSQPEYTSDVPREYISSIEQIGPSKRPLEQPLHGAPAAKRFEAATSGQARDVVFRLLVPADKVAHVIGKFGTFIRDVSQSTGAKIKVVEAMPGGTERVMIIYAQDTPGTAVCPSQTALYALHKRLHTAEETPGADSAETQPLEPTATQPDTGGAGGLMTRMLVAYTQCGSVIGKSGAIIKDIKLQTGANIKILPVEELPVCALANDRVCQFAGTFEQMQHAMSMVTQQLRKNPPKDMPGGPVLPEQRPPPTAYPSVTATRLSPPLSFAARTGANGVGISLRPPSGASSGIQQPPLYY